MIGISHKIQADKMNQLIALYTDEYSCETVGQSQLTRAVIVAIARADDHTQAARTINSDNECIVSFAGNT